MSQSSQPLVQDPPATAKSATRPAVKDPFEALGLSTSICRAVRAAGYTTPTPIQEKAIPRVLDDRDLLGCAQTGTGKTAAFALPIIDLLLDDPPKRGDHKVRALVLAPTRELAAQIAESFEKYSRGSGLRTLVVFGGVNRKAHERALSKAPDILVATPGRLLDLMSTRHVTLGEVEHVVLDEADRMLDMGFIHDMRKIMKVLPADRQTLLFSATMPREIAELARQYLYKPERVAVDPVSSTCDPIAQSVYFANGGDKLRLLIELLRDKGVGSALVFTRTKHRANRVAQRLEAAGVPAAAIHGNKSQGARERALAGFKDGSIRVVVATDLASRGIDVKGLSHVINFELPNEPETYVHRVGRTGRAGEQGIAISICSDDERSYLGAIERLTQKPITRVDAKALIGEPTAQKDTLDADRGPRGPGRGPGRGPSRSGRGPGRPGQGRGASGGGETRNGRGNAARASGAGKVSGQGRRPQGRRTGGSGGSR